MVAAFLTVLLACSPPDAPPLGTYRAVVSTDGGDLPFGLELVDEDGGIVAYLVNGPERVRATGVRLEGGALAIQMPGYQNRIEATFRDGRFEGTLSILRPRGVIRELRLVAVPGESWRFFPKPDAAPLDFSGRWALTFRDADGGESAAIAELEQEGHVITGTVLRQSGDDRYLAGEARGDTLFLSRFDGGTAYLYLARLGSDGVLAGEQFTGGGSQESFSGRRDPAAKLDNPAERTALKPGVDRLEFSFPDVDGNLQRYPDDRHTGKVVLVTVGGSWCPNCHDEAQFLKELLASREGARPRDHPADVRAHHRLRGFGQGRAGLCGKVRHRLPGAGRRDRHGRRRAEEAAAGRGVQGLPHALRHRSQGRRAHDPHRVRGTGDRQLSRRAESRDHGARRLAAR